MLLRVSSNDAHVTLLCVAQYSLVRRHQSATGRAGRRDDETVSGIGVEDTRKQDTVDGDRGCDRRQTNARKPERLMDPLAHWPTKRNSSLLDEERNFPRRDCGDVHAACRGGAADCVPHPGFQPLIAVHQPDEDVRIEDDQWLAFHSLGSSAGEKGSS